MQDEPEADPGFWKQQMKCGLRPPSDHLNPYLNFHRPCGAPEIITDRKGKQRRVYRRYATPWELLRQIPNLRAYRKAGITKEGLQQRADARGDTQAARAGLVA